MAGTKGLELKSPVEIAQLAEDLATYKTRRHPLATFYLAIGAGAFIALGFIFYLTITTGSAGAPYGIIKLLGGVGFSLGLILILICGGDLFTSTVLNTLSRATKNISWRQMVLNWVNVYLGNFAGALLIVAIIWFSGQAFAANGQWGLNVLQTANYKLHHTVIESLFLGILANMMVCLAVWMSYAGQTILEKAIIIILPISMFVAGGFEHCIANMFLIPLALIIQFCSGPDFWQLVGQNPDQFSALTFSNFVFGNLIPATIGNIIGGGLFVGLWNWFLFLRK